MAGYKGNIFISIPIGVDSSTTYLIQSNSNAAAAPVSPKYPQIDLSFFLIKTQHMKNSYSY